MLSFDSIVLEPFGQTARLSGLYTQLCYCFPLPDTSSTTKDVVLEILKQGLERLSQGVPWISGQVVQNDAGLFEMRELDDLPALVITDLHDTLPSFEALRKARFPFSMLDERVIASRLTMPEQSDRPKSVFEIQCNFVEGGVLLVFSAQHNVMDIRGQAQVIQLFANACRSGALSSEEIQAANVSRAGIVRMPETATSSGGRAENLSPTAGGAPDNSDQEAVEPTASWSYFALSSEALSQLKSKAMQDMTVDFVSTDDVLSALVWQAVTRARHYRLGAEDLTMFVRQVDARRYLDIALDFPGMIVHRTSTQYSISKLLLKSLGAIASGLRELLQDQSEIASGARAAAKKIMDEAYGRNDSAKRASGYTWPTSDIKLSSWAKETCNEHDFGGVLGQPVAVRRPRFEAWEGLVYLLPKSLEGEILVALALRDKELENIKKDVNFVAYAEYIG